MGKNRPLSCVHLFASGRKMRYMRESEFRAYIVLVLTSVAGLKSAGTVNTQKHFGLQIDPKARRKASRNVHERPKQVHTVFALDGVRSDKLIPPHVSSRLGHRISTRPRSHGSTVATA